ncbi:hypothetical protein HK101_005771 [Irineochytrium annulatum]|nr:hypothetical protein HK101_005771 [Irineochytrium annulatum]
MEATAETGNVIGYAAQVPWLQNATVRANILFGAPYNATRYSAVIHACALEQDLAGFDGGDMTEVGDRGATLSGGQKQRLALARAIYSPASVLLLDDVLSAVDAHTARHIINHCLTGPVLQNRSVILATNAVDLCLPAADFMVLMRAGGTVVDHGAPHDVMARSALDSSVRAALVDAGVSIGSGSKASSEANLVPLSESAPKQETELDVGKGVAKRLTKEESTGADHVGWPVYWYYFRSAGGVIPTLILVLAVVGSYAMGFLHDYTLKEWAGDGDSERVNGTETAAALVSQSLTTLANVTASSNLMDVMKPSGSTLLTVYVCAGVLALLSLLVRYLLQLWVSTRASASIHSEALEKLLGAPLSFFESTPGGRIINRFGKDMQAVDQEVVTSITDTLQQAVHAVVVAVMIGLASPVLVLGAIPIALIYYPITRKFLAIMRSLKRLEVVTRSPIYQTFGETIAGLATIRAFRQEHLQITAVLRRVDSNHRAFLLLWAANRWLAFRVEIVGSLVTFAAGFSIASGRSGFGGGPLLPVMDAGWSGLCLNYASMFTDVLTWLVRNSSSMEMTMTSVERLQEYSELPQEAPSVIENYRPSIGWPSRGSVNIQDLVVRYAPDLPPAVNLPGSLRIRPGERVAVVGRTGSGKTTLGMSFVRLLEADKGNITIDNVNIKKLGLRDLRSGVVIVPQDPFLFKGTVGSNIDPLSMYPEADLRSAISLLGLTSTTPPLTLESSIVENGGNLSGGQRQLVSLGRALLRSLDTSRGTGSPDTALPRREGGVLILDEATASLDPRADEVAQMALKATFADQGGWTIVTIAHRLRSVVDSDRVLVMSEGTIAEDGVPEELLGSRVGMFWELCQQSGEVEELERLCARKRL